MVWSFFFSLRFQNDIVSKFSLKPSRPLKFTLSSIVAWLSWLGPQMIHTVTMITIWVTLMNAERRTSTEDLLGRGSCDVRGLSVRPKIMFFNVIA